MWLGEQKKKYNITYSDSFFTSTVNFISNKEIQKLSDIKSVGTIRGYTVNPLEQSDNKNVKFLYANNIKSLLKILKAKRVDAIYFHTQIARSNLAYENSFIISKNLPNVTYEYHVMSIKHQELISDFNSWLKVNEKAIQQIINKYKNDRISSN